MKICFSYRKHILDLLSMNSGTKKSTKWGQQSGRVRVLLFSLHQFRFYDNSTPAGLTFALELLTYFLKSVRITESCSLPGDLYGNSSSTLELLKRSTLWVTCSACFYELKVALQLWRLPFLPRLPGTKFHPQSQLLPLANVSEKCTLLVIGWLLTHIITGS